MRTLPPGYAPAGELDLSSRLAEGGLLAAGLVVLLPTCWLVIAFVAWTRPEAGWPGSLIARTGSVDFAALVALTAVAVVLVHEGIHGVCFWVITRDRPRFGVTGLSAYAAAPDWFIPLAPYLVVGLAPVVLITVGAFALMLVVPAGALEALGLVLVLNAVGSVGDLFAVWWLVRGGARTSMVRDAGTTIAVYRPIVGHYI